ncbi:MAG: nucleoside deaminase [Lachnospiraceae bacterium]|nr:nucleoside deaminase [Lachnospiraceae bacterium]MBQ9644419.1 nucleoside deaminase [Lachnospiraceae bacterium]
MDLSPVDQRKLDEKYMRIALKQAGKAAEIGEVPIGCVIVCSEKIIGIGSDFDKALLRAQDPAAPLRIVGRGYNRRNTDKSTLSHAEITAIRKASRKLSDWRLEGCTLYCTLEPCPMCAGAIVQARIDRVVIGADSPKNGCGGTLLNILQNPQLNHQVEITRGVLAEESAALLKSFFKAMRSR